AGYREGGEGACRERPDSAAAGRSIRGKPVGFVRASAGQGGIPDGRAVADGEDWAAGNPVAPHHAAQYGGGAVGRVADAGVTASGEGAHHAGAHGAFEAHTARKGAAGAVEGLAACSRLDASAVSGTGGGMNCET